ncbi:MAG: tetratricopeptide repeat protein [Acidobacteriota bacterium]
MNHHRPDREQIVHLERNELPADEARLTVRALLALSAEDEAIPSSTSVGFVESAEVSGESTYDSSWHRVVARLDQWEGEIHEEEHESEALFRELTSMPLSQQRLEVCNDARFQSWSLCELLLDRAQKAALCDPAEALELTEIAVSVSYEIDKAQVPEPLLCDLKARAWSYLGNARRVASDLRGAEKAFELADSLMERGSGDPVEQGQLLELKATLCMDRHRYDEAESLFGKADTHYRRAGADQLRGRVMINRGRLANRLERNDEALQHIHEGLQLVDPMQDLRLYMAALQNLAVLHCDLGNLEEAETFLERAWEVHRREPHDLDRVRMRWLEGRISVLADRIADAEEAFSEVRMEFVELEIGYDAALVSLDLATIYARQGRATEMRQLAEEMLPIFQSRDMEKQLLAALLVFRDATRMESASVNLMDELSAFLQSAR